MRLARAAFWGAAGALVHTHVTYPLALAAIAKVRGRRPELEPASDSDLPHVSLIVSAFDEEDVIEAKVVNALALDYPRERAGRRRDRRLQRRERLLGAGGAACARRRVR
jgi:cellulose synthase/poly-beta-1,6-N-acetylglucosamine synthase-like glycosyltransferase